jgi:hypothetical protein
MQEYDATAKMDQVPERRRMDETQREVWVTVKEVA